MKRKRMRPRNRTAFRRVLIALAALFIFEGTALRNEILRRLHL